MENVLKLLSVFTTLVAYAAIVHGQATGGPAARTPQVDFAKPPDFAAQEFDYLIAGGGTAGLALATRLSEDPNVTVGVVEAGDADLEDLVNIVPGFYGFGIGTILDWKYTTQGGPGLPSIAWPRGHILGGTSTMHTLLWDTASSVEYDAWEQLGNKGWNWATLSKYIKRSERWTPPSAHVRNATRYTPDASDFGTSGNVYLSYPEYVPELDGNWVSALSSLGFARNERAASGQNVGIAIEPISATPFPNSTRSSSVRAYYLPNSGRRNLQVVLNAFVTKIDFARSKDASGNVVASGLSFSTDDGKTYSVKVKREIIVSGGTVGSPQILELSGIGSKEVLQAAKIPQVVDLPSVGENVQDHLGVGRTYELKPGYVTLDVIKTNYTAFNEQLTLYTQGKPSILGGAGDLAVYATLDQLASRVNKSTSGYIDAAKRYVQGRSRNAPAAEKLTLNKQLEYLGDALRKRVTQVEFLANNEYQGVGTSQPEQGKTYISIKTFQQHMLNRGSIHLNPSDPLGHPIITPRYLENDFDKAFALDGLRFVSKIASTKEYSSFIAKEIYPGTQYGSNLTEYIREASASEHHQIGSCAMLPKQDGGVVDSHLKVYGTANVRVVDASIAPIHFAAHTQATVYGIAEYAADIIKGRA